VVDQGELSDYALANKDFDDLIQNTNIENIWFTFGGGHDGYAHKTPPHWNGASFQRDRNLTSLWYTIKEGNNVFIFTSILQGSPDPAIWDYGWGDPIDYLKNGHFIAMNKLNWLESQLAEYENTENNIFVITHTPIVHTNAYTHDWAQMQRYTWMNTSDILLDLFEEYRVDVFIHAHVHTDPDKAYSNHTNVSAGNVLLRGFRSDLPDTTFLHATDVNWEHGSTRGVNSNYPSVMYFKMIEGNNYFDLRAVRTDTNDTVGITYNNSNNDTTETTLRIPLSYSITGMDTSNQIDFFEQGWGVWEFSDEGNYQWYKDSEGLRVNKSAWITSRWDLWEEEEITGFIVNYTETNGTLSHQFYCSEDRMSTWRGPYNDASDLGSCRWIQVNTTFSPISGSVIYVYDMNFNMTPAIVTPDASAGLFATYFPTQTQVKEGYSKLLKKTQKVQLTIDEQTYTVVIKSVNNTNKKVEIELEEINKTIELCENETSKIDLNDDGYYDLQIFIKRFGAEGFAELEFKEIHEEIPAEEQEKQEEESKIQFFKWWIGVICGIVALLVGIFIWRRRNKKFLKKKPKT